jgi:hypothetical protein
LGTADIRLNTKKGTGFVTNVYVREEERGKGLGTRLMEGVEDFLVDYGSVSLTVNLKNKAAMSLYRRRGYTIPDIDNAVAILGKITGLNPLISMRKDLWYLPLKGKPNISTDKLNLQPSFIR